MNAVVFLRQLDWERVRADRTAPTTTAGQETGRIGRIMKEDEEGCSLETPCIFLQPFNRDELTGDDGFQCSDLSCYTL